MDIETIGISSPRLLQQLFSRSIILIDNGRKMVEKQTLKSIRRTVTLKLALGLLLKTQYYQ